MEDLNECLKFCRICKNRNNNFKTGIVCRLTGEKPKFKNNCKEFLKDEKEKKSF
jgi:hypothetical protein